MENPQVYSEANALQRSDAESIIREFVPDLHFRNGARVLDVGCGSGDVTAEILVPYLPQDVEEIIGVDISDTMIAFARQRHSTSRLYFHELDIEEENENLLASFKEKLTAQNNNEETEFGRLQTQRQTVDILINDVKLDGKETDYAQDILEKEVNQLSIVPIQNEFFFGNNKREKKVNNYEHKRQLDVRFDVIFSFYCLHWIQNQRQALRNIYNMLKPGGEVVLCLLAQSPIFTLYEELAKIKRWAVYMEDVAKFISPYQHSASPEEIFSAMALNCGFNILLAETRNRSFLYQKAKDIIDAIKAVNPFCTRLPKHLANDYLSDCLKIIQDLKLAEATNDGCKVQYSLLVAHLRR